MNFFGKGKIAVVDFFFFFFLSIKLNINTCFNKTRTLEENMAEASEAVGFHVLPWALRMKCFFGSLDAMCLTC